MATINFLGNWSALIKKGKRNVSFVLDESILFETGPHTLSAMLNSGVDPLKISMILITHMHLDHYSGIAEFLWYRTLSKSTEDVLILGPEGIKHNTEEILRRLYTPEDFEIRAEYIEDRNFENIQIFKGNHSIDNNAYRIEFKGKTIFYSGDTSFSENMVNGAENVDYLIHEMTFIDAYKDLAELSKHSTVSDTLHVFDKSGAKNLIPVHFTNETEAITKKLSKKNDKIFYPANKIILK